MIETRETKMTETFRESVVAVLDQCGPRRHASANGPIEHETRKWMQRLLDEGQAIGIAEAIIAVWEAQHGCPILKAAVS